MFHTIYYQFLLIFNTGYLFALEHHGCAGTIDIRQENNGFILYSSSADQVDSETVTFTSPGHPDTECVWMVDAPPDRMVRLEMISIDSASRVWARFESDGEQRVYQLEKSSHVPAMGRIIITWRAEKYTRNSQQSIKLSFTADWKDIGNSSEGQEWESAQRELAGLPGPSPPSVPAAPRVRRMSWFPGSSEPVLGGESGAHHSTGRGLGRVAVGAFHDPTSAPAGRRLRPGASAASDKEAPPRPQETSDNNPDASAAALARAGARGADAAALRHSEIRAGGIKPEPPSFPDTPTDHPGLGTAAVPPAQGRDSVFPGLLSVRVPRTEAAPLSHTHADPSAPLSQLDTLLPTLPPRETAAVPPSPAPDRLSKRSRDTLPHTDPTSGESQSSVASLSPSRASQLSGQAEGHSFAPTVVNSPPDLTLPDSRNPPTAHIPTAHTGGPRGKDYTPSYYQPSVGGQEVPERQSTFDSSSYSTLRLSQGRSAFPEPEGTTGRGSWGVSDLEPPASSLPEDSAGKQQALKANRGTDTTPGSTEAEGNRRLLPLVTRSISENEIFDVSGVLEDISASSASTAGPSGAVSPSVGSSSMEEEVAVSVFSVDPGTSLRQVPSIPPPVETDTEKQVGVVVPGSFDPYTAILVPEKVKTDSPASALLTEVVTHSPVSADRDLTGPLTEEPELKDSPSTRADRAESAAATAESEVSSGLECETNPARESQGSNSTSRALVPAEADGTGPAPAPAGQGEELAVSLDLSAAPPVLGAPDRSLTGVTTTTLLLTTSFTQDPPGRRGPGGTLSPEKTVPHSRRGQSDSAETGADGSASRPRSVTTDPVNSDPSSLTTEPGSHRVTPPSGQAGSGTAASSVCSPPACSSASPQTLRGTSPSIQAGTEGLREVGCPSCSAVPSTAERKSSPAVTFSSTVTTAIRLTSSGPGTKPTRPTTATPSIFTPPPGPTSEIPGRWTVPPPLFPRTDQSTSTFPTEPANSKAPSSSAKPIRGRVFIVENQPAVIKEETVQLLLQMVLEGGPPGAQKSPPPDSIKEDVVRKVEPLLQKAPGYEGLRVSWTSGNAVVQGVPVFSTVRALSWLGAPGGLLEVTELRETVRRGLYVGGVKVANISVGGLQPELCSWLFLCPSGFQCVLSSLGNASCSSLCHTDYCKNSGICTHHHRQQPVCQCPVGEDFWYMGRWCDLRMTRQRLVGVCLGALLTVALLMATLSYLIIRRFKAMLIQAKVDQTRSSYRRFNHFDELSSRFWLRSWPGSADSLENPGFSRSDELLHLRALDRACCYHDDTLSIASTYPGSGAHLSTVYAHGSHYNWDPGEGSVREWMADSGKASDLSVCSWPIEPIQWTPFPLLQQLGIHRPAKTPRPHSYCEGMELVDMEKTRTA